MSQLKHLVQCFLKPCGSNSSVLHFSTWESFYLSSENHVNYYLLVCSLILLHGLNCDSLEECSTLWVKFMAQSVMKYCPGKANPPQTDDHHHV